METLGLDLEDDSLKEHQKGGQNVCERNFQWFESQNKPDINLFENKYGYKKCLSKRILLFILIANIILYRLLCKGACSLYSRHTSDRAFENKQVGAVLCQTSWGAGKTDYTNSRNLKEVLQHDDVAVVIEADHLCVASRGIKDTNSQAVTAVYSGSIWKRFSKTRIFVVYSSLKTNHETFS